jgi:hypothetical protein
MLPRYNGNAYYYYECLYNYFIFVITSVVECLNNFRRNEGPVPGFWKFSESKNLRVWSFEKFQRTSGFHGKTGSLGRLYGTVL